MEAIKETVNSNSDVILRTIKTPEEIIHIFNTKEMDVDWSFAEHKPSNYNLPTKNTQIQKNLYS